MRAVRHFVRGLVGSLLALALVPGGVGAQQPTLATPLPEPYLAALRTANVPTTAVGVVVQPVGSGGGVTFSLNESTPMTPASAMKLVTTYAALQMLGPAYTWRTEAYAVGRLQRDVL